MADFQLLHPTWLYAAVPAILLSVWLYRKPKSTSLIAQHLSQQLGLEQHKSHGSVVTTLLVAWLIAVFALSGPSFQKQSVPSFGVNNARVIVMDMTLSMYATDLSPNRLTQARYKVLDLLPTLKEGTTGLVAYSGDGYMISPLTNDSNTLANLIPNLSPNIMPTQGSDASAGVKKAIEMLSQAGHQQGDIILVADGLSDSESNAIQSLLKDTNWHLSVMSVGTAQGAPIRLPNGDMFTHNGTTVVAKTDLKALRDIAQIGHGVYTPLRNDDGDIQQLSQALNHVELKIDQPKDTKQNKETPDLEIHINNGFWLLPILLVLALGAFRRGGIFSLAFLAALPLMQPQHAYASQEQAAQTKATQTSPQISGTSLLASAFKTPDQQGYDAYQAKQYPQAASQFDNRAWKGAALYQAGNYQAAIEELQGLEDEKSRYNLANAQAQAGQLQQAKQGYEEILKTDPNNADAKKNLEIVKKALEQQKQQQQKQQDQQQNKDNQDQNSKDQNNQDQNKQQQSQDKSSQGDQSKDSKQNQSQQNSDQSNQSGQNSQSGQSNGSDQSNASDQNNAEQNKNTDPSQSQQSGDQQAAQDNNGNQDPANQPSAQQQSAQKNADQTEQQKQAQQQAQAEKNEKSQQQSEEQPVSAAPSETGQEPTGNTVAADPRLNKLEQIPDNAQRLLQAQMALEAQQQPAPQSNGQLW